MKEFFKILKIAIAVFLLIASGYGVNKSLSSYEVATVPHYIGVFLGVSIIVFPTVFLLRSGFTKDRSRYSYLKYLLISFVLVAVFSSFFSWSKSSSSQFHEVNGEQIPLRSCLLGNKEFITDFDERKQFCSCIAEKLVTDDGIYEEYKKKIKKGEISDVYIKVKNKGSKIFEGYPCYTGVTSAVWIPEIEESFTNSIKRAVEKQSFGDTANNDEYCNCMIREIKKFDVLDVIRENIPTDSLITICRLEVFDITIENE